ncbi:interferon alpha-inducible protein 27-like protein 2B isoform X2 [Hydractinia symbiolongicarpus]|nr:interferon alpha-inducible protein 27-like protein 2B isoform X2 [Hydractinia symbiolongicarpus]XP_057296490.1 interferon alpha-inducible protein 27-like protein 2B isoform X2 [Hydractinia symbiolongicarpus]
MQLPNVTSVVVGTGVGVAAVAATPLVLGAVGFTAGGVAAGSIAAAAQSTFYGAATTGVFSVLQSVAAAGLGTVGAAAVGTTAGVGAAAACDACTSEDKK